MINFESRRGEVFLLEGEPAENQKYQTLPLYDPDDDS